MDFMKLELNISQIFIEYFAVLTKENWLSSLMVFKRKLKKHQKMNWIKH